MSSLPNKIDRRFPHGTPVPYMLKKKVAAASGDAITSSWVNEIPEGKIFQPSHVALSITKTTATLVTLTILCGDISVTGYTNFRIFRRTPGAGTSWLTWPNGAANEEEIDGSGGPYFLRGVKQFALGIAATVAETIDATLIIHGWLWDEPEVK